MGLAGNVKRLTGRGQLVSGRQKRKGSGKGDSSVERRREEYV